MNSNNKRCITDEDVENINYRIGKGELTAHAGGQNDKVVYSACGFVYENFSDRHRCESLDTLDSSSSDKSSLILSHVKQYLLTSSPDKYDSRIFQFTPHLRSLGYAAKHADLNTTVRTVQEFEAVQEQYSPVSFVKELCDHLNLKEEFVQCGIDGVSAHEIILSARYSLYIFLNTLDIVTTYDDDETADYVRCLILPRGIFNEMQQPE